MTEPHHPSTGSESGPGSRIGPAPDAGAAAAGVSRRGLLGFVGAGAAGLALGAGAGLAGGVAVGRAAADTGGAASAYDFYGAHQAGIVTPVQDHLHFAAFDMMAGATRDELVALLADWSYAAARMTRGLDVSATGAVGGSPLAPPDDTGEAQGLPASNLTITFGFGPTLFEAEGVDRFGIAARRPPELAELPAFLGDDLDPLTSDGDLCIQACADDPQVAVHAVRNLSRIAFGRARLRWSQLGFGRTSKTTAAQATPRNLFGYKDGTANILADDRRRPRRARVGRGIRSARLDGRRLVPRRPQDRPAHRIVGSRAPRGAGPHHRPFEGRGRAPVRRRRVHGSRLPEGGCRRRTGHRHGRARAAREPRAQCRCADAAPRLQLRRRQQRPRPPRRRALLPVVPALARSSSSPCSGHWRATPSTSTFAPSDRRCSPCRRARHPGLTSGAGLFA